MKPPNEQGDLSFVTVASGRRSCIACEDDATRVRLEISLPRLRALLQAGLLDAQDFRCLDCESKRCVWGIFRACCVRRLAGKVTSAADG